MSGNHEGFEDADRVETVRIRRAPAAEFVGGNFYERVGGRDFFKALTDRFYEGVAQDEILRPMYPEEELGPAAERLQLFLEQYWGGPSDYQELRGHPRLKMRHMPFKINPKAREHWLRHMRDAVDSMVQAGKLSPLDEAELWAYLDRAATAMLNTFED